MMKRIIKMGVTVLLSAVMGIMICACESENYEEDTGTTQNTTQNTKVSSNEPIIGEWEGIAIQKDGEIIPIIGVQTDATFTKNGKATINLNDERYIGTWTLIHSIEDGFSYAVVIPNKGQFTAAITSDNPDTMGLMEGDNSMFFKKQ